MTTQEAAAAIYIKPRQLRKKILHEYKLEVDRGGNWETLAQKYSKKFGAPINRGLLWKMAKERGKEDGCYMPTSPHLRMLFGLPPYTLAPVCPKCGKLHLSSKCTRETRKPWSARPLQEQPSSLLLWRLKNRQPYKDGDDDS